MSHPVFANNTEGPKRFLPHNEQEPPCSDRLHDVPRSFINEGMLSQPFFDTQCFNPFLSRYRTKSFETKSRTTVGSLDNTAPLPLLLGPFRPNPRLDYDSDPFIDPFTNPFIDDTGKWSENWIVTTPSNIRTSSSSSWESDRHGEAYPTHSLSLGIQEPLELSESFHFRGAQYDTIRTILRPNPNLVPAESFALACSSTTSLYSSGTSATDSQSTASVPSTLTEDSSFDSDLFLESFEQLDVASRPLSPEPFCSPVEAAAHSLKQISAHLNFEEDVEFREREWLLEQAGCGRVEIWVTEESRQDVWHAEAHSRPRVFFPPPLP